MEKWKRGEGEKGRRGKGEKGDLPGGTIKSVEFDFFDHFVVLKYFLFVGFSVFGIMNPFSGFPVRGITTVPFHITVFIVYDIFTMFPVGFVID